MTKHKKEHGKGKGHGSGKKVRQASTGWLGNISNNEGCQFRPFADSALCALCQTHGNGEGTKGKDQEKDKRARMFDQHLLTAGQHCGKTHLIKTKPESEDDHVGQDLLADVLAHKHQSHRQQKLRSGRYVQTE